MELCPKLSHLCPFNLSRGWGISFGILVASIQQIWPIHFKMFWLFAIIFGQFSFHFILRTFIALLDWPFEGMKMAGT
jgi:hypothetical protein